MNNINNVGTGDLGYCIQLWPDGIRIMALLSSGSSSSIRIFWSEVVNFEVYSKWVVPIEGSIWFLFLKWVRWVNCIRGVYWIITSGNIDVCRNWGWNSRWSYIDSIYRNIYRHIGWLGAFIKGIFGFLPWKKYIFVGRVYYGNYTGSFDEAINALDSFWISSSEVVKVFRICPWGYFCLLFLSLDWRSSWEPLLN